VVVGNIDALSFTGSEGKIEVPLRVVLRYRSVGGVAHAVAAGIRLAEPTLYVVYVSRRYLPP
jgi:hypothetical protein